MNGTRSPLRCPARPLPAGPALEQEYAHFWDDACGQLWAELSLGTLE